MSGIAVIGSVAFDDIETPGGRADDVLGGSATHFAVAASFFAPVHLIAVVGDDPILLSELRTRAKPFLLQVQQRVRPLLERSASP